MKFRHKTTGILIFSFTALILCVAGLTYPRAFQENLEGVRYMVKGIAATAALSIDGDLHQSIPPDSSAAALESYRRLQRQLHKFQAANPGIRYIWTMVKGDRPGQTIFICDVGGKRARPGMRYNASAIPDLWEGFRGPAVDRRPVKDLWGTSISGYAPIRNRAGEGVAILGVDVYGQELYQFTWAFRRFLGLSLIAEILLSILVGGVIAHWIARPLNRLVQGMRQVEAGDLSQEVRLTTGDEFQEAAQVFNRMTTGLKQARAQLRESFLKTVQSLMSALEAKDPYSRGHSESVTRYAVEIAKAMGRTADEIDTLRRLAILHDIGKIGIQDTVLQKPALFSPEEREIMQHHPVIGSRILAALDLSQEELALILSHHEREDGTGYPAGLDRTQISDLVAIVSVADAYDAMTSHRPHRRAMDPKQALEELKRGAGTQFRPEAVAALEHILTSAGAPPLPPDSPPETSSGAQKPPHPL